tara:strand:+ start:148 stop:654 length:507 start_codon:yes stop_codon:yes gene_type:complete
MSDRVYQPMSYSSNKIKDLFISFRSSDMFFIPIAIFFGMCIDGLYGIGHLLAYGLGVIGSFLIVQGFNNTSLKKIFILCISVFFIFHGVIKFSLNRGDYHLSNSNFLDAIYYHSIVIKYFPKDLPRSYEKIIISYDNLGNDKMVEYYLNKVEQKNIIINPQLKSIFKK